MKKITTIFVLSIMVFACSHKTTPTATSVPKEPKTPVIPPVEDRVEIGKTTYEANCGKCHRLYKSDEFTAKDWTKWIAKMAPKAHLSEAQAADIFGYVSKNAKAE